MMVSIDPFGLGLGIETQKPLQPRNFRQRTNPETSDLKTKKPSNIETQKPHQTSQDYPKEGEFYFTGLSKSIFELLPERDMLNS